ncbi:D39U1-like protein, partial [Mya arenaria]
ADVKKNGLPEDCKAVVSLSGRLVLEPFKRLDDAYLKDLYDSRIEPTKILANAVSEAKQPPQAFVTISGVGFYPPSEKTSYTEDSEGGSDWLAKLSREWEAASTLPDTVSTRRVIVRSGVVLGPDGGMIKQLLPVPLAVYLPMLPIGSGKQWFPWIHVRDIAGIIAYAIENDRVTGVLNGVAPQHVNNDDFTKSFCKAFKKMSYGPLFVPGLAMNLVYGQDRAMMVLQGQKVKPERTLEMGYEYCHPDIDSAMHDISKAFLKGN